MNPPSTSAIQAGCQTPAASPLLDVHGVAERLAVSHFTVRRLVRQSRLRAVRLGHSLLRFRECDVEQFIERSAK